MDKIDIQILKIIEKERTSGESIAKRLRISRVAVWKRIKKLEELGYKIDTSKNGYKLLDRTERVFSHEVNLQTEQIGKKYIYFDTIHSTNKYLKEKAENLPDGTIVIAEKQTGGRGRKGRKWVSPAYKGLYFSILLKRDINIKNLLIFSLLFPLTIRNLLQQYTTKKVYIKWPNDIYIQDKKISGILLETSIEGNNINNLIVGIGININATKEEIKEISDIATSLLIEENKKFDRKEILRKIVQQIEESIKKFSPKEVSEEINKNLLWKNEKVKITDTNIEGKLLGVNREGALMLETDKGIKTIYTGDLSLRKTEK